MNDKERNRKAKKYQPHQNKPAVKTSGTGQDKWIWFALAVVLLTTSAIYFKAIKFDFLLTWDDYLYITENSHIKNLNWESIKLFFTNYYANNYQPLTMLFYAAEYKIGAGHAALFHFNNILLHLLNTYLVFILIKRISPKNGVVALITAAFFAIHPMHVESVAWVSERKDVLYSFFFLLSLIIYCDYLKSQKIKHLLFAVIFFGLSCLSKSAAVILPLVLIVFDYYSNRKFSWKLIIEKVPFFAISLVFGLIAIHSQKGAIKDMAPEMSVIEHISTVSCSFMSYLFKAFVPVHLSAIYPYPVELGNTLPVKYYLSIAGVGLVFLFVWYSIRWGKDIIFGFLFFIITIILVLQFIPVGAASMADRYTYIPYIGIFFITGKLFERISLEADSKFIKYKRLVLFALVFSFFTYSAISYGRVNLWENGELLFSDVVNKYPDCSIPYRIRGDYYLSYCTKKARSEMDLKKSIRDLETSLKFPLRRSEKASVYYSLGTAKADLGDFTGAVSDLDKAILIGTNNYYSALNNRGHAKYMLNDYQGALEDYNHVIEVAPDDANAYYNRGSVKNLMKDYAGAIEDFDHAIKIDAGYSNAYNNRGSAKNMLKDYTGAIEDFNKVIELNPKDPIVYFNRGINKTMVNDYGNAIKDFDEAIRLDANFALAYFNRGSARYQLNDLRGALEDYNKTIELDPKNADAINKRNIIQMVFKNSK